MPDGHTWKSFVKFLINTLPGNSSENFKERFIQSIKYWWRIGRGLSPEIISQLKEKGISFILNGKTRHGSQTLDRVRMLPQDHCDYLKTNKADVTSWKRFAMTILKNDHTCKYLGLAPTKSQLDRMKQLKAKYSKI